MASNGNAMSATQPLIHIFKGKGYEFWSIRMRTLLKSQDLWDLVEQGYPDPDEESRLKENKKKDSKAAMAIVSQMRSYGEKISDETDVANVLRSLTPKFDHVVAAIEESKDLSIFWKRRIPWHFKAKVEKQSGSYIKVLRTDRGGEFLSTEFNLFCEANDIHRELTAPYTPEQNGVTERKNRTIVEMARSMLQAKGLSNQFWAEAVATSVYLLNLSPTRAVMNQTPLEAWRGTKPSREDGAKLADAKRFRSLVGGLIYLTHSRPNIAFSVGMISRSKRFLVVENVRLKNGTRLVRIVLQMKRNSRDVVCLRQSFGRALACLQRLRLPSSLPQALYL
ncbi:hypothetical protein RJ640_000222 [Escallonia rubra]|uniref:Integrase catalytic domain-containing protein n=1 Tax=Escallonia rubra TaxID=112253 RepID=A0AA88RIY2_9ASTE|nr:hypothetical protein RJ640_000222 [Escallonia rubra]